MYLFTIQTIDAFGNQKKVEVRAQNSSLALNRLHQKGFKASVSDILDAKRESVWNGFKKLNLSEAFMRIQPQTILRLIRLVGSSLSRGKTLKETLSFIAENEDEKALKILVEKLKEKTQQPFTSQVEIFSGFPRYFDEAFLGIIEAGETSSNLGGYLIDYAKEKKKQQALNQKFKSMLLKRLATFVMVLGVAVIVVAFVIPQFEALFGEGLKMPWAMYALLQLSNFLVNYGAVILISLIFLLLALVYLIMHHPKIRWWSHDFLLNAPLLGRTLKTYYTAQFCYFLSTLLNKNVDIIRAVRIVIKQTHNVCMVHTYQQLITSMKGGDDLFTAILKESERGRSYMISSIVQAAKVGAETASLGATLMDVRHDLEALLDARVKRAIKIFSAVLYLVIILIAAFIAYAIGSAILVFYNNAQSLI